MNPLSVAPSRVDNFFLYMQHKLGELYNSRCRCEGVSYKWHGIEYLVVDFVIPERIGFSKTSGLQLTGSGKIS